MVFEIKDQLTLNKYLMKKNAIGLTKIFRYKRLLLLNTEGFYQ